MRTCAECGVPVHNAWEYCKRCGAELPAPALASEPGLISAVSGVRVGVPGAAGSAARWRSRLGGSLTGLQSRLRSFNLSLLVPVGLALIVGGVGGILLAGDSGSEAQAALVDTREEAEERRVEAEQLRSELAAAEAERDELAAELDTARAERDELEERLEGGAEEASALEEEIESLQEQIAEGQEALEERERQISEQRDAISALRECLSGTEVALAFAQDNRSNSTIQRALEAVEEYCQRARAVQ